MLGVRGPLAEKQPAWHQAPSVASGRMVGKQAPASVVPCIAPVSFCPLLGAQSVRQPAAAEQVATVHSRLVAGTVSARRHACMRAQQHTGSIQDPPTRGRCGCSRCSRPTPPAACPAGCGRCRGCLHSTRSRAGQAPNMAPRQVHTLRHAACTTQEERHSKVRQLQGDCLGQPMSRSTKVAHRSCSKQSRPPRGARRALTPCSPHQVGHPVGVQPPVLFDNPCPQRLLLPNVLRVECVLQQLRRCP